MEPTVDPYSADAWSVRDERAQPSTEQEASPSPAFVQQQQQPDVAMNERNDAKHSDACASAVLSSPPNPSNEHRETKEAHSHSQSQSDYIIQPVWQQRTDEITPPLVIKALFGWFAWEVFLFCLNEWGVSPNAHRFAPTTWLTYGSEILQQRAPWYGEKFYQLMNPEKFWTLARFVFRPILLGVVTVLSTLFRIVWNPLYAFSANGFFSKIPSYVNGVLTTTTAFITISALTILMEATGIVSGYNVIRPSSLLVWFANVYFYVSRSISTVYFTITFAVLRCNRVVAEILKRWFPWLTVIFKKMRQARLSLTSSCWNIVQAPVYGFLKAYDYVIGFFTKRGSNVLESKTKMPLTGSNGRARIMFYTSLFIALTACWFLSILSASWVISISVCVAAGIYFMEML